MEKKITKWTTKTKNLYNSGQVTRMGSINIPILVIDENTTIKPLKSLEIEKPLDKPQQINL